MRLTRRKEKKNMYQYNPKSLIADEFINDGEIRETLAYAEEHKNDRELIEQILEKARPKKTVFFVTHDVDEAMLLADRVVVLGQSPSRIIYEHRLTAEEKATRETQFDKPETLRLRNRLISELNRNITGILAGEPVTGTDNASCDTV